LTESSLWHKLQVMEDHSAPEISPGRRAAVNWFGDGLPEIVTGLEFAILSAVALWLLNQPLRFERLLAAGVLLALILLVNGVDRFITSFLKARVTYPRTGYVQPPMHYEESQQSTPLVGLALANPSRLPSENVTDFRRRTVAVLFLGWMLPSATNRPWGIPAALLAVAVALYILSRNTERPYRLWYTLLLPAAGLVWILLVPQPGKSDLTRQFTVFVIAGLWLAALGAWSLRRYLRKNPRTPDAERLPA
jgi:hypothetical protein